MRHLSHLLVCGVGYLGSVTLAIMLGGPSLQAQTTSAQPPVQTTPATVASGSAATTPTTPERDLPIEGYCQNPANSGTDVCKAYQSGTCVKGLTVDLCRERLSQQGFGWVVSLAKEKLISKEAVGGVFALLAAVLSFAFASATKKVKVLEQRLGDPLFARPKEREFETRAVNVLLVAEGGSGKTSLIRALSGSRSADPALPTTSFDAYNLVWEIDLKKSDVQQVRTITRVYIEDYEGQQSKKRAHDLTLKKREEMVPATVVVILVDLFVTQKRPSPPAQPRAKWDEKRVAVQDAQYSTAYLDAVAGIASKATHVCLFINKADLIRPYEATTTDDILKRYEKLAERIAEEFRGQKFFRIVGSATTGWGVVGYGDGDNGTKTLLELIVDASVRIDDKKTGRLL